MKEVTLLRVAHLISFKINHKTFLRMRMSIRCSPSSYILMDCETVDHGVM